MPKLEFGQWGNFYSIQREDAKNVLPPCIYQDLLFLVFEEQINDQWKLTTYYEYENSYRYNVYSIDVYSIDGDRNFNVTYYVANDEICDRTLIYYQKDS